VLPSFDTLRESSRASMRAEPGRLFAFPNRPMSRVVRNRSTHFLLGWAFSSLGVCLRCKLRIAARIALHVIIILRGRELLSHAASEAVSGDCMPGFWHAGSVGPADSRQRRESGLCAHGCDGASLPPPVWLALLAPRPGRVRAGCSTRTAVRRLSLILLSTVAISGPNHPPGSGADPCSAISVTSSREWCCYMAVAKRCSSFSNDIAVKRIDSDD
jgi:hypothetical protein